MLSLSGASDLSIPQIVDRYKSVLAELMNKYVQAKELQIILRLQPAWYTNDILEAKKIRRKVQRKLMAGRA